MDCNPELVILSSLPGGGKTYRAMEWLKEAPNRARVNYDELRIQLFGADWKFNRHDETLMQAEAADIARTYLRGGYSVIVDNTNLTAGAKSHWLKLGEQNGATVIEEEIDTPVATCVARDHDRVGRARVGRAVIEGMALFTGWIDWNDTDLYFKSASGKDFVIVDVDGTIADCEHRRECVRPVHKLDCTFEYKQKSHPVGNPKGPNNTCPQCGVSLKKDWATFFSKCREDAPIPPVIDLVKMLAKRYDVLIVSGRPIDPCGKPTEDWLDKHEVPYRHLFMRPDTRDSDVVVKNTIADLLPLSRVAYVLDDRPSVLREVWQKRGLTTLAVGDLQEF